MKIALFAVLVFLVILHPVSAQLSDRTGLVQRFTIETGGYDFEITTTSNFDVEEIEFDKDEKRLTLFIFSSLDYNLSEIIIPKNLINGDFTFYLNGEEIFPNVRGTELISFITLEFEGEGDNKLDIIGTTYLPEFSEVAPLILAISLFGVILPLRKKFSKLLIN